MTLPDKLPHGARTVAAPALARFLSDSALSRAALAACGFPLALADATAKGRPLTYVNPSFEAFFGYRADEVLGQPSPCSFPRPTARPACSTTHRYGC